MNNTTNICTECHDRDPDILLDWSAYIGGNRYRLIRVCEPCYLWLDEQRYERDQLAAVWGD